MDYRLELSRRAARDAEEAFDYIYARAPLNAVRWRRKLESHLHSLAKNPDVFGFAPENNDAKAEVRQKLFGKYRILYTIRQEVVFIISIRHSARTLLSAEEIDMTR